jgi:predicted DNA-binding protein
MTACQPALARPDAPSQRPADATNGITNGDSAQRRLTAATMYNTYIMKRTQIYLEADQDRRIAIRATASGVTKSTLIREAIESYLASPDQADQLAQFRAALDAAADTPARLPAGAPYVESIRAADIERQAELDERRP